MVSHDYQQDHLLGADHENSSNSLTVDYESPNVVNYGNGFRRDLWAAILFILNVASILFLAIQLSYSTNYERSIDLANQKTFSLSLISAIISLSILIPFGGFMWLSFMISNGEGMIEIVMWSNIAMCMFVALSSLFLGQIVGKNIEHIFISFYSVSSFIKRSITVWRISGN